MDILKGHIFYTLSWILIAWKNSIIGFFKIVSRERRRFNHFNLVIPMIWAFLAFERTYDDSLIKPFAYLCIIVHFFLTRLMRRICCSLLLLLVWQGAKVNIVLRKNHSFKINILDLNERHFRDLSIWHYFIGLLTLTKEKWNVIILHIQLNLLNNVWLWVNNYFNETKIF